MDELKYGYLLPIGSVVKVKNSEQRMVIIGILQCGKAFPDRVFDYAAVPYPEGLHDTRLNIGFDHGDIEEVVFRGYEDKDRQAFFIVLEMLARKRENRAENSNT